ncbi:MULTISPECIES: hypothetical protein [Nocardia]|uniref:hypothetical protein n=1 Tax=Nocardia TaxID=1817 RepID=UPI002457D5C8|nr:MULTISPECIES: hypothetical protein [Nocardia]
MATATISIDDALLARIQDAGGGNLSEWIVAACRSKLLTDAARAEDAVHVLEGEAEREIVEHAEHAAHTRAGTGTEPATVDYLAAYGHVRALLEQAEQQLREQLSGGQ